MKQNISLAQHTTLGLGGPARFFLEVGSCEALQEALEWAKPRHKTLILAADPTWSSRIMGSTAWF